MDSGCPFWHGSILLAWLPLLRKAPRQTQEAAKSGIIVRRQPDCAEWNRGPIADNWTESHLGKLSGDHRFACETHAQAECNEVHQSSATDVEPLHTRIVTHLRHALYEMVVHGATFLGLAHNEMLVAKCL